MNVTRLRSEKVEPGALEPQDSFDENPHQRMCMTPWPPQKLRRLTVLRFPSLYVSIIFGTTLKSGNGKTIDLWFCCNFAAGDIKLCFSTSSFQNVRQNEFIFRKNDWQLKQNNWIWINNNKHVNIQMYIWNHHLRAFHFMARTQPESSPLDRLQSLHKSFAMPDESLPMSPQKCATTMSGQPTSTLR